MKRNGRGWGCEYEHAEFSHSGDFGDLIWGTAAVRDWLACNGRAKATLYLYEEPGRTTHGMSRERSAAIIPLLNAQVWLDARWHPERVASDLNGFRDHCHHGKTLACAHYSALGLAECPSLMSAWLGVPARADGPAFDFVFVRSHRYRSHDFPWRDIVAWFGDRACFLGLESEYASFVDDHPAAAAVPHVRTGDLLEAAQIIAACRVFFGNQTALYAIAEGLKKPRVLEPYSPLTNCDYGSRSALAIYPRMRVTRERILALEHAPHGI